MTKNRYDISKSVEPGDLDFHFCRTFIEKEDGSYDGCFGTDDTHGYSFEEGKKEIICQLEFWIKYWQGLTEEEWLKDHGHD